MDVGTDENMNKDTKRNKLVAMAYGYWIANALSFSDWGHRVQFREFWNLNWILYQNMHNVRNVKHVSVGCWCKNAVKRGQIKFWNAIHNSRRKHVSCWEIFWRKPLPSSTTSGLQCWNCVDDPELGFIRPLRVTQWHTWHEHVCLSSTSPSDTSYRPGGGKDTTNSEHPSRRTS
jgi:hypothetical protein